MAELPKFRYHPDPIATGVIEKSDEECVCCGESRGYVYTGPVYADEDLDDSLCPWCIADGSAAADLGVELTDSLAFDDADVDQDIIDEVVLRTPGFAGFQQERWLTCCSDACAFLGYADLKDLEALDDQERAAIMADSKMAADQFQSLLRGVVGGGTAFYKFKCLHCGKFHYYWDLD